MADIELSDILDDGDLIQRSGSNLVGVSTAELGSALSATFAPRGLVAADMIWSWWANPNALYDGGRRRAILAGYSSNGAVKVATFDLSSRHVSVDAVFQVPQRDDHNTPVLADFGGYTPMLLAHAGHSLNAYFDVARSVGAFEPSGWGALDQVAWDDTTAKRSYANLLRKPGTDTVMIFGRGGAEGGWYGTVSTDAGATWPAAATPHRLWSPQYGTWRSGGLIAWFAIQTQNSNNDNNAALVFQVNLATGAVLDAAGTPIVDTDEAPLDWWDLSEPVPSAQMTTVVAAGDLGRIRILDVSADGDLLLARWESGDPTTTYHLFRHDRVGGYTAEELCDGGVAFRGQDDTEARYVGGAVFGSSADEVFLCREAAGTWTAERWVHDNGWQSTVLASRTNGNILARPVVPVGAEGQGLMIVQDISHYGGYQDYRSDAALLEVDLTGWLPTIIDDFDRPDNASTLGTTPDGRPWRTLAGTYGITSSKAARQGSAGLAIAYVDYPVADCIVEATITLPDQSGTHGMIVFRAIDDTNYMCLLTGALGVRLQAVIGGSTSVMENWTAEYAARHGGKTTLEGTTHTWRVEAKGRRIDVYLDDVWIGAEAATSDVVHSIFGRARRHGIGDMSTTTPRTAVFDGFSIAPAN